MEAHQRIDERIRVESGRRWPDPFEVMRLKRLKLRIKDRLSELMPRRWSGAR